MRTPLVACTPSQLRERICAEVPALAPAATVLEACGVDGRQLLRLSAAAMHRYGITLDVKGVSRGVCVPPD